ncbi:CoxG family protein [Ferroacidibacillus organovorans]|uniref:Carbon monoxide dehydrogenase n=1 Tax=Ferroacidibacillus organovorans TaxID=1765683 RepID=A0A124IWB7_9BACL|nr:carbon monoxide dehydrogenase subunit G [Ferroacidibacillus organovorans]KUO96874.1 hypothetical protein ATW55_08705 [Ferroacidibacillus organovorans]
MQLEGTKEFPTNPQDTYSLMTDPDVLVTAMPGLKSLKKTSDYHYEAQIEVGVAGIKGQYQGVLEMRDVQPGSCYTLVINGQGPTGFMEASVHVRFEENTGEKPGCTMHYSGNAHVGGTVAGVGQRMLSGVAKLLINQFFKSLVTQATAIAAQ